MFWLLINKFESNTQSDILERWIRAVKVFCVGEGSSECGLNFGFLCTTQIHGMFMQALVCKLIYFKANIYRKQKYMAT